MNKKVKFYLMIFCLFSLFLIQTIAYSALNVSFDIVGSAKVRIEKDVRITNVSVYDVGLGVLSSYEDYRVDGFKAGITLPNSDSYVTYKIEVTNYGYNDVVISDIVGLNSNLNYELKEYTLGDKICDNTGKCNLGSRKEFFITIKYSNYTSVYTYDLNLEFTFKNIYTIEYRYIDNSSNYPSTILEGEYLNISFSGDIPRKIKYLVNGNVSYNYLYNDGVFKTNSFDGNIIIENGNLVRAISGNGTNVGDIIEIGDEAFYVMNYDGVNLKLLSKYNLYIGSVYTNGNLLEYGNSATGLQDSLMSAWVKDADAWNGVTKYSSSGYWSNNGSLDSKYGTKYPAYVYDSNAIIYKYVENYKDYLVGIGANILEARVPTFEEAVGMGCASTGNSCSSAPPWFYATTYWLGSAYDNNVMYRISTDGYINWDTLYYDYARGVRPLIVIPASSLGVSVIYDDIYNYGYPDYAIYNGNLKVSFKDDIPAGIKITVDGKTYDNYSYLGGNLEVFNVTGDLVISRDKKNNFGYTGKEETYEIDKDGVYRLEAWGAQGGSYDDSFKGGYGAFATGDIELRKGDVLYINVGGSGIGAPIPITTTFATDGGYNGGGRADATSDCSNFASSGGGASHIAIKSGSLSSLENNLESVYLIAAGGGGASSRFCSDTDWHHVSGGNGGGIEGDTNLLVSNSGWPQQNPSPATQNSGGSPGHHNYEEGATSGTFGQGGSWNPANRSKNFVSAIGGGGGLYGGAGGMFNGGGGGSSYIGNSLLTNKVMYCYNCKESSDTSTKTISTTSVSSLSKKYSAKIGDGYIKITYLG